jgi:hypothetical protein
MLVKMMITDECSKTGKRPSFYSVLRWSRAFQLSILKQK